MGWNLGPVFFNSPLALSCWLAPQAKAAAWPYIHFSVANGVSHLRVEEGECVGHPHAPREATPISRVVETLCVALLHAFVERA